MLDSATSSRVPVEFIGMARVFRNQVAIEDKQIDAALNAITPPLCERLRKHPKLRPEMPMSCIRAWAETVPAVFRVGRARVAVVRTEFAIREVRISTSWLHNDDWNNDERERGLSVCELVFAVHKAKLIARWTPVACISLHALARRIERSAERDHAALTRDLALLVEAREAQVERVNTPGGFWLGAVIEAMHDQEGKGVTLRNVRTWLAS
jgi:hypothetical protein